MKKRAEAGPKRSRHWTRRRFLEKSVAAMTSGLAIPGILGAADEAPAAAGAPRKPRSPNERLGIGAIGLRYQGTVITECALPHGDVVAICDVDREHGEKARGHFGVEAPLYGDYRKLLERKDIDLVTIATPDHWHTAIAAAACRAGKDVYCEKPLTLTVDEGKLLRKVVRETGSVFQVGTWQRSDHRFRLACELVRGGHIGKLKRVVVTIGKNPAGGPFKVEKPPAHLNWDFWLGQTPKVPYIKERCHYTFRWWYEYSGGQMTDWGAHHIDIAQWGMGTGTTGPVEVDGRAEFPDIPDGYNVATSFEARYLYAGGIEMLVRGTGKDSVVFEGEKGTVSVSRGGKVTGTPLEGQADDPIPREEFRLYPYDNLARPANVQKRPSTMNHMGNLVDCIRSRRKPISELESQHRTVTTCHLGNISMRLGRKLRWDPDKELFVGDSEANQWLSREQRKPYEIT